MMFKNPILHLLQDCDDPPISSKKVVQIQRALGHWFPADYVEFLQQFNGGHFRPWPLFDFVHARWGPCSAYLICFIGSPGDSVREQGGLVDWNAMKRGVTPSNFVHIAVCNGKDGLFLKFDEMTGEFEGVFFWDSDQRFYGEQEFFPVADSFTEFLDLLYLKVDESPEQETLPLFQAVERGAITQIEQYLAAGGDPNARNQKGQPLVAAAVIYRWPQIVRLLLDHSADPNARDEEGRAPLHHAARSSMDSVKLLLGAGADARARDNLGKGTMSEYSYQINCLLRAHGAEE